MGVTSSWSATTAKARRCLVQVFAWGTKSSHLKKKRIARRPTKACCHHLGLYTVLLCVSPIPHCSRANVHSSTLGFQTSFPLGKCNLKEEHAFPHFLQSRHHSCLLSAITVDVVAPGLPASHPGISTFCLSY